MIHEAINKSLVAVRYYKTKGYRLSPQQAIKKFIQDKNVEMTTVQLVLSAIVEEQKKLLK